MAEAIAKGFIKTGAVQPNKVCCTDPVAARKDVFKAMGAEAFDTGIEVVQHSDVVFLAVKPQYMGDVLTEMKSAVTSDHIIVSIAAGVPLEKMLQSLGQDAHVVRVMPNTPCLVGEMAGAMCLGGKATASDADIVQKLFESVGCIYQVEEKMLSAVTGLSGSGPAYIFLVIEAMADGAVRAGLPRDIALRLAAQTVLGSAKMVLESGRHPGALKDMVTSPAGTTIAGVHELEKAGLRGTFMSAVLAATKRAEELAKL